MSSFKSTLENYPLEVLALETLAKHATNGNSVHWSNQGHKVQLRHPYLIEARTWTQLLRNLKRQGLVSKKICKTPGGKTKTSTGYYPTTKGLKLLEELGL